MPICSSAGPGTLSVRKIRRQEALLIFSFCLPAFIGLFLYAADYHSPTGVPKRPLFVADLFAVILTVFDRTPGG